MLMNMRLDFYAKSRCDHPEPFSSWHFARIAWRLMISGGVYNQPVAAMPMSRK
jgi:hypothetical protein